MEATGYHGLTISRLYSIESKAHTKNALRLSNAINENYYLGNLSDNNLTFRNSRILDFISIINTITEIAVK